MAPFVLLFVFIGIPALLFGGQYLFRASYRRKKAKILSQSFPAAWETILQRNVPLVSKIPPQLGNRLRENIRLFLAETAFEGRGGIDIDEEIQVTVAAQACLLTLGHEDKRFPNLRSVIVYPSAFTDGSASPRYNAEGQTFRLGESWTTGTVVLAWDSTRRGALNLYDGQNVTLHEFAHQLDQEDGIGDGVPIFQSRSAYTLWAKVFSREYEALVEAASRRKRSVLDHYGATNHAEFFAVATESFFEKPAQLKRKSPDLYEILKTYYRLDPINW